MAKRRAARKVKRAVEQGERKVKRAVRKTKRKESGQEGLEPAFLIRSWPAHRRPFSCAESRTRERP